MDFKNLNKRKLEEEVKIDADKIKESELYKEKGNELFKKSMFDEALDYYFKAVTLNPNDHRCYGNIGQILINKSLYSEAKECLQAAISLNSNYTKAYYRLGLIEKHLANYEEAIKNFDKALKLEPTNKAAIKECNEIKMTFGFHQNDKKQENDIKINSKNVIISSDNSFNSSIKQQTSKTTNQKNPPKKQTNQKVSNPIIQPIELPNTLPKTGYQFNLLWKEMKNDQTKLDYLKFIGATHFLKLFHKNLEPDFLSELIALFNKMEDKKLILDYLDAITKIDTFDFLLLFLSKKEKELLRQTIDSLDDLSTKNVLIKFYKV